MVERRNHSVVAKENEAAPYRWQVRPNNKGFVGKCHVKEARKVSEVVGCYFKRRKIP
jgi:hypothetical protein